MFNPYQRLVDIDPPWEHTDLSVGGNAVLITDSNNFWVRFLLQCTRKKRLNCCLKKTATNETKISKSTKYSVST